MASPITPCHSSMGNWLMAMVVKLSKSPHKQLHAADAQHGRQRVRRPSALTLGVITGYFLLQLLPRNQLIHPFQKDLAAGSGLFGFVLGFGEDDLIHARNDPMRLTMTVLSLISGAYSESP